MIIDDLPYIMIKCLICTIIIECLIAFVVLKIRAKNDILNIVLVNFVTNPIVVSVPILMYIRYGYNIKIYTLIVLEVLTVIVEGFIYLKVLNNKRLNPFLISLILNVSSYLIGEIINRIGGVI